MTQDAFPTRSDFDLSARDLDRLVQIALDAGGDFADVYCEYKTRDFLSLEEGLLKIATRNISQGAGIRVIAGTRTGYASTESFEMADLESAARTASAIALSASGEGVFRADPVRRPIRELYATNRPAVASDLRTRTALLESADRTARQYDPRIIDVRAVLAAELKQVLIHLSSGETVRDTQPLVTIQVSCIASDGRLREVGVRGGGGRVGLEYFESRPPAYYAREAARQAVLLLDAREAPAGPMPVVLAPGWPGILLHEAVGHGLEADFNRKRLSAFSGLMGSKVASDLCAVVDDGTIPQRRGSLNVDDEGIPTGRNILIEGGVLRGYMQDILSAHSTGARRTGNGRRESYAFAPMPRMTNTFLLPGESEPGDIIRSVRKGLYAVHFGGGQVDITNGKFVFSASEAYLIEDGRVTAPVRGATIVGNGPEVLKRVSMVGHDLGFDDGIGTCGKEGQSVPVGVGMPTVRVDEITVGGTIR